MEALVSLNDLRISIFCHDGHVTWLNSRSSLLASALCAIYRQLASDVAENLEVSCTECKGQGNDFELRDHFGNEFPSIYNHCEVMEASSRKTLKKFDFCIFFWKNNPLRENLQNSVLKGFIATPIDVLCSNFVKFGWRKSVKSCIRCVLQSESNIWLKPSFEPNKNIVTRCRYELTLITS